MLASFLPDSDFHRGSANVELESYKYLCRQHADPTFDLRVTLMNLVIEPPNQDPILPVLVSLWFYCMK
jgi:hypothetical protein